ncbi:unnamed protein product [Protopolystoma xenopodis]|uniref:Uncharacterized protein n=1 Tax=Protopolystoma xenopodis TaxID=117903 RepID=A0A3S5AZR6_9PLAT|nr:unnamed protein product [Protopolystoma xenopodis]
MAEWSKAPDSRASLFPCWGISGLQMEAWVQIPLLTSRSFPRRYILAIVSTNSSPSSLQEFQSFFFFPPKSKFQVSPFYLKGVSLRQLSHPGGEDPVRLKCATFAHTPLSSGSICAVFATTGVGDPPAGAASGRHKKCIILLQSGGAVHPPKMERLAAWFTPQSFGSDSAFDMPSSLSE